MKKLMFPILTCSLLALSIAGCGENDCGGNCNQVFPEVNFKIVNAGGANLLCGPAKVLHSGQVDVRSLEGGTLVNATKNFNGDSTSANTGIVFVAQLNTQYYLYVNNIRTDSFQVSYQRFDPSECCQAYHTITELKWNGITTAYTYPGNTTAIAIIR
jgi:hypothetical protein